MLGLPNIRDQPYGGRRPDFVGLHHFRPFPRGGLCAEVGDRLATLCLDRRLVENSDILQVATLYNCKPRIIKIMQL